MWKHCFWFKVGSISGCKFWNAKPMSRKCRLYLLKKKIKNRLPHAWEFPLQALIQGTGCFYIWHVASKASRIISTKPVRGERKDGVYRPGLKASNIAFHLSESNHMDTCNCKGGWEMLSHSVPMVKRNKFGKWLASRCHSFIHQKVYSPWSQNSM